MSLKNVQIGVIKFYLMWCSRNYLETVLKQEANFMLKSQKNYLKNFIKICKCVSGIKNND